MLYSRIALSGAHSTGKSCLARWLADALQLPLVTESARTVFERRGIESADYRGMHVDDILDLQCEILDEHRAAAGRHKCFVSDRCEADVLAYTHYWCDLTQTGQGVMDEMRASVAGAAKTYDLVILVRPGIEIAADGTRIVAPRHQETIDYLIGGILCGCGYPVVELTATGLWERRREALRLCGVTP